MRLIYHRMLRYIVAVVAALAAAALTNVLWPHNDPGVSALFMAAVVISAWYGGLGPGLVSTVLASLFSAGYIIEQNSYRVHPDWDDLVRTVVFIGAAALISSLQNASRQSERRLRRAKQDAEASNSAKNRFLAVLSHELRNPLNPILIAASDLDAVCSPSEQGRDDLDTIRRNVEIETRLIDDLLDYTRIRTGKLSLQLTTVDCHEVLRNAVLIIQPEAQQKSLRVRLELAARSHYAFADPARLNQLFWNLVRNAAKFTPAGGQITVRSWDLPDQRLVIEVEDTGIGIEPTQLQRVFEPFEQGDPQVTSRFGGLGLGLAITRSLVEAHGGRIDAFSEGPGRGARFTVSLPSVPEPLKTVAPAPERQPPSAASSAGRILLVDDHADTRRLLERILRNRGYTVASATSFAAALQAAIDNPPELLISDLGLPDGSGLDLMRQLKTRCDVRGIALTGFGSEQDIHNGIEAGFEEYLVKPVDLNRLQAAIHRLAGKRVAATSVATDGVAKPSPAPSTGLRRKRTDAPSR